MLHLKEGISIRQVITGGRRLLVRASALSHFRRIVCNGPIVQQGIEPPAKLVTAASKTGYQWLIISGIL